jgi:surfactin synthase thioesterase subunit
MTTSDVSDWIVPVRRRPGARTRLVVFPHAGSGPAAAGAIADAMSPEVEVWSINLPGRQARQAEWPCTDLGLVIGELSAAVRRRDDLPYGFFGYCGGALLAALTAVHTAPQCLFVSGFAAPDVAAIPRRLHRLPSDRFWTEVLAQGGVSPELAELEELRPVFEPALRADFALYAQYAQDLPPLGVPVHVLYGQDDPTLTRGALLGWRRRSDRPLRITQLPGGHWLLDGSAAALAEYVGAALLDDVAIGGMSR